MPAIYALGGSVLLVFVALHVIRWVRSTLGEGGDHFYDGADVGWMCENCNNVNEPETDVCDHCGASLHSEGLDWSTLDDRACPECGDYVDPDEGRCPGCGLAFGDGS